MSLTFKTKNELSSWEKGYWYLRFLVNKDRYGGLNSNPAKLKKVQEFLLAAYTRFQHNSESDEDQVHYLMSILKQVLFENVRETTTTFDAVGNLVDELNKYLTSPKDFYVLALVIRDVLLPTNQAISLVPTQQSREFAETYAKALLDVKKEKALSNLIREWDLLTEDLSLNMERDIIINLYNDVKNRFGSQSDLTPKDIDIILTAACQEYERRVGQKRKQRAGGDLENATSFILKYFNLKSSNGPEHFTTGLEVDNWVRDRDGWYIGISLKRTLRERWKQTYTTEVELLTRNKIKYIVHLINNDRDLSSAKISEMGSYRHLFFLADDSKVLEEFKDHVAIGGYIFPMSSLIQKLKEFMR